MYKNSMVKSINEHLLALYSSKWASLCEAMRPILDDEDICTKPTNPLLLSIDEDAYRDADVKFMIFGQETNDWEEQAETKQTVYAAGFDFVLDLYRGFYNTGKCYSYGGHFWNGFNRFRAMLGKEHPDAKICYVLNNIIKIGKLGEKGCPPDYIYEVERKHFSVIREEIDILKPDVILFLTGPNYDNKISDVFGDVSYSALSPFSERQLARVSLPDVDVTFRTYHPNFLWRNNIEHYFETIINEISVK